jgi:hypothetical protein
MRISSILKLYLLVIFFFATHVLAVNGQSVKEVTSREQLWAAYFNQTRLTKNVGLWLDVHWRQTGDFVDRPFQLLIRPALTTYIKDNVRVNTGYAFINHYPAEGFETARPEHRIWEQIWWNQKYTSFSLLQWLRLEQRFLRNIANDELQDGYQKANRIRYNFMFTVPLKGKDVVKGTPTAVLSNELFLNLGKNVVYNTFDQNRFFIGGGYQLTSSLNAQLGYLNVYQQEASGNRYMVSHAIRFYLIQSLDLRSE